MSQLPGGKKPSHANLTIPLVRAAIAWAVEHQERIEVKDLGSPGLVLRVGLGGQGSWCFRFGAGGARITIGKLPGLTLKQARDVAALQRRKVAEGINPLVLKREARVAMTITELAEKFERNHLPELAEGTRAEYSRLIAKKIVPKLGTERARDLDRPTVARWHQSLPTGDRGKRDANFALSVLSAMMSKAELWGERPEGTNPCQKIPRFHENKRQRYLKPEELQRLAGVLEQEAGPAADGVRLLILTGMRLGELLVLSWPMIDLEGRTITFGADQHKTGKKAGAKTIPISIVARDLLSSMPRGLRSARIIQEDEGSMERFWASLRLLAGIPDVRLHDLRHTFGSYGAARGIALKTIGGLLGHGHTATTERYAHLDVDPLREATETIGGLLDAAMRKASEGA